MQKLIFALIYSYLIIAEEDYFFRSFDRHFKKTVTLWKFLLNIDIFGTEIVYFLR